MRTYSYDAMGRGLGTQTGISGFDYFTAVEYDDLGRAYKSLDASGRWTKSEYSPVNGQVMAVCESTSVDQAATCPTTASTHVRVIEHDAWGRVSHERRRNSANMNVFRDYHEATGRLERICAGISRSNCQIQDELYDWDDNGNLQYRDKAGQYLEAFEYDSLNRLTDARYLRVAGLNVNVLSQSMRYDRLGNVCEKRVEGVSTAFHYGGRSGCGTSGLPGGGASSDTLSPHAVSAMGDAIYSYDARGNQVLAQRPGGSHINPNHRHIRYTLEDQAHEMVQGRLETSRTRTRFWYGPDGQRYRRQDGTKRTLYLGNVEIESQVSVTTMRRYVAGVLVQEIQGEAVQERYLYHDHVGSVVAVSNTSGAVVEGTDFGAFGERRGYADPTLTPQPLASTPRGYTGHEHVETFGIVRMNGRIYEPRLGRFLQADPYVQEPWNLQNHNRYTYVWNNPLNATDPSGYLGIKERQWAGAVVAVAGMAFGQYWAAGMVATGASAASVNTFMFYWAAGVGAVSGGISSQSTSGALWGAFSSVVTLGVANGIGGGLTRQVIANGVTGGVLSTMQGGKFGHAFASAGATALLMPSVQTIQHTGGRVVTAALVGGTVSSATGGKFANGAVTAAMQAALSPPANRSTEISGSMGNGEPANGLPDSRMLTHSDHDWIPKDGYITADEAARAGLGLAKSSGQDTLEFGGGIVKIGDRYWFTDPVTNGQAMQFAANVILPKDGSLAGLYHTHPRGDASIFFSPNDVRFSESTGVPSYIGSHQDRAIRFYDPQTMNPATVRYQGRRIVGASRGDYLCQQCF